MDVGDFILSTFQTDWETTRDIDSRAKYIASGAEFPTRVGMNREVYPSRSSYRGVPHTRGDEPYNPHLHNYISLSSPHAWG